MFMKRVNRRVKIEESVPGAVRAIIMDALLSNCWVYDLESSLWYTPKEFELHWPVLYKRGIRGMDNRKQFLIRDPKLGEQEERKKLEVAIHHYKEFKKRVEAYFR